MKPTHTLELVPQRNTVRILVNGRDYGQIRRERGGYWSWEVSREGGKLPVEVIREVTFTMINLDLRSNEGCTPSRAVYEHLGVNVRKYQYTIP